jgi:predicted RNA binding protein YcfA (HicA-like mRNA interferase family)
LKLPRDLSGEELARLLRKYNYEITRQTGSHLRLTSKLKGSAHHVTIPAHKTLKVGTLSTILADVAAYLERERSDLAGELFGR